jgi:Mannosyltransferase (PIG-V)
VAGLCPRVVDGGGSAVAIASVDFGRAVAARASLLLFFGPYALFLVASYSEALYLAVAIAAWWFASRERYWAAGILGALASLTRVSGLFLAAALLVMYVVQRRQHRRPVVSAGLVGVSLSWLGGLCYLAYAGIIMASFSGWFLVQARTWNRHLTWPWQSLLSQGGRMLHDVSPGRQQQAWLEMGMAIICVACLIALVVLRMWPEVVYVGLSLTALMTSTAYESLARNSLTLFPIFV